MYLRLYVFFVKVRFVLVTFPIQKIVNPYISGLSEDWATNSQQQLIKQGKTLHKEKKNLCSCKGVLCLIIDKSKD